MMGSPDLTSPIPLSDIEDVLSWVDSFKLSRPNKKINRDFSDAVLLAEMLAVHYPKLVEMHNYPARNSQTHKLNNWMTLNRKVLRKLKLNLCLKTMEHLSNSVPGSIERVLVMVRDKIKRDEEAAKNEEKNLEDQNASSGGSYYEACADEDNVLVVPVKQRVNGALETVQKKVVCHELFQCVKEELKDAKEATETLKQKVHHFENVIKVKDERIEELQKQLSRKISKRKENEEIRNSLSVPIPYCDPLSPNEINKISISERNSVVRETELRAEPHNSLKLELKEINSQTLMNGRKDENDSVKYKVVEETDVDVIRSKHEIYEQYSKTYINEIDYEERESAPDSKNENIDKKDINIEITKSKEELKDVNISGKESNMLPKHEILPSKDSNTSIKSLQIEEKYSKSSLKSTKLEGKTSKSSVTDENIDVIDIRGSMKDNKVVVKLPKSDLKPSKIPVITPNKEQHELFDVDDSLDEKDSLEYMQSATDIKREDEFDASFYAY